MKNAKSISGWRCYGFTAKLEEVSGSGFFIILFFMSKAERMSPLSIILEFYSKANQELKFLKAKIFVGLIEMISANLNRIRAL